MFDDEIERIEFENDELLFRQGTYNPFFVKHKKDEREYLPKELSEEDKLFSELFGF